MASLKVTVAMNTSSLFKPSQLNSKKPQPLFLHSPHFLSSCSIKCSTTAAVSAADAEQNPSKNFAEEMRMAAMKQHKIGENEAESVVMAISAWAPTSLDGYLNFLADTQLIHQAVERIVEKSTFSEYAEFKKTGLERSEKLAKDLEWFEREGHVIPQSSCLGINYALYLNDLSEKEPHAFICHFYTIYFGHTAGGRIIGRKVEEKILKGKELEFYKYDGDLSQLLKNVQDKLNMLGKKWSREEKDRCLDEIYKSFSFGGDILRLVLSS